MEEKVCSFTGHRALPQEKMTEIREAVRAQAERLILEGVRCFRVGGAVGFDTLAVEVLFELRERHPEMRVELFYPFDGFCSSWGEEQIEAYMRLWPCYDRRICVCKASVRPAYAYLKRDRALVDGADYLIAYCTKRSGGTAYTVRYAEKCGCDVWNMGDRVLDLSK